VSAYYKVKYLAVPETNVRLQLVIFFIGLSFRRASSGQHRPKSFFIGAHGQELSVPRVQPSLGCPDRWAVTKATYGNVSYAATLRYRVL